MKKKKALGLSLAVVLIAALLIGGTLSYFTDTAEKTNTLTLGDLIVDLTEENWDDEEDGKDLEPGDTVVKDPLITAEKNDMYFRVVMTVSKLKLDGTPGDQITDTTILAKIFETLYLDPGYKASPTLDVTKGYSLSDLTTLLSGSNPKIYSLDQYTYDAAPNKDPNFTLDEDRSVPGKYYYNFVGTSPTEPGAVQGVLYEDETVYFMSHIVIPTDWTQTTIGELKGFAVDFKVEAVQAKGFIGSGSNEIESIENAMDALDIELAAQP